MGRAKEEYLRQHDLLDEATEIAIQAKALKRCDFHEEVLVTQYDDEAERRSYAIANKRFSSGSFGVTRSEAMNSIKEVLGFAAMECPRCQKMMEE